MVAYRSVSIVVVIFTSKSKSELSYTEVTYSVHSPK